MNKQIQSDSDKPEFDSQDAPLTDEQISKMAHDAWVKTNSWNLTRDDFIRLSYFHGDLEAGSDGKGPINGSEDRPGDVVYIAPNGACLTRSMVSYWLVDHGAFTHGYRNAIRALLAQVKQPKTDLGNDDNALAGSLDGPTECKSLPANMKTWPKKIWLQHGDDSDSIPPFESLVETTWCQDNINSNDIEYIRADLCAPSDKEPT